MSNTGSDYGPRIYAFLESLWLAEGVTRNAWCERHGIAAPFLIGLAAGREPTISKLRQVADATGTPMLQLLIAGGILGPAEAGGVEVRAAIAPTITAALQADRTISETERDILAQIHASFERGAVEPGARIEVQTPKPRRGRVTKP